MATTIKFGKFNVSNQVFYLTQKSFGIVNLRPLLPGHVLVCPIRRVERFTHLTPEEVTDLFQAVHIVSRAVERFYAADALNIAIQDGPLAGQSINHVHCHIIPRKLDDLPKVDEIYDLLNKNDIEAAYAAMRKANSEISGGVDSESRQDRTPEQMEIEARTLKDYIQKNFA